MSTLLSLLIWNQGEESEIDLQYWSQQLSYLFIGLIVVGSVRGFLTLMLKVRTQKAEIIAVADGSPRCSSPEDIHSGRSCRPLLLWLWLRTFFQLI